MNSRLGSIIPLVLVEVIKGCCLAQHLKPELSPDYHRAASGSLIQVVGVIEDVLLFRKDEIFQSQVPKVRSKAAQGCNVQHAQVLQPCQDLGLYWGHEKRARNMKWQLSLYIGT